MNKKAYKLKNIENHVSEKQKKNLIYIMKQEQASLSKVEAAYLNGVIILPFAENIDDMSNIEIRTPKKSRIDYTEKLQNEDTRKFMKNLQKSLDIKQQEMKKIVNAASKLLNDIKDDKEMIEKQLEILKETTQKVINKKQIDVYIKQIHQNCDRLINCLFLDNSQLLGEGDKKEVLQKIKVLETYLQDLKKQMEIE